MRAAVLVAWLLAPGTACQTILTASTPDREILPAHAVPVKYEVKLEPNLTSFAFEGEVKVHLDVVESANFVTLNSLECTVHEAAIGGLKALDIAYDTDKQTVTFTFPEKFATGAQELLFSFTGELNDKMAGFYRLLYEENGETKYLATTQMEPTDCRRAFPCFDEPALKAEFAITLVAEEKYTCLLNMDVKEKLVAGGKQTVVFNTTPRMSTYLVAFVVGELLYIETLSYRVPVRVYTTPGMEEQGRFALDLAANTLEFFDKTFGIEYPLPKMDMIAIHDFSAGAMENWGLVTYRVLAILLDNKTLSLAAKQRVAEVVQHELAHQWFGNLVTMDWWEGLWLNEGFATWMLWYLCNKFYPEWKVWELYVGDSLQQALGLDALRSLHPVEVPVKRADEINQIFDAILYSKGLLLLKMIAEWLGEDVFIKGVLQYLHKHKYGNTTTSDLWAALLAASGEDVVKVMDVWTKQVGYPVVQVEEKGNTVTFKQERYLLTGDVTPEEDKVVYPVFLNLLQHHVDEKVHNALLTTKEHLVELADVEFFKVNRNQLGVYRVNYTPERWATIGQQAEYLSVEDRIGLVADAGSLAVSGYASTTGMLSLVLGWTAETNYVVWLEIIARVSGLQRLFTFESQADVDALELFVRLLVGEQVRKIGWEFGEGEDFQLLQLKLLLFGAAAHANDEAVVAAAKEMFAKYVGGDKEAVHPNIRGSVFAAVARHGGAAEYEQLFAIYKDPVLVDEKISALRVLGMFSQPELMARTLGYVLDPSVVKQQDLYIPMAGLALHRAGITALWEWVQTKWDKLTELLPPGLGMLGIVVQVCTLLFTLADKIAEIKQFFATKDSKGFDQKLSQSLDSVQLRVNWLARDRTAIVAWLKEHGHY